MDDGRIPPYDESAEQTVLGSILLDNKVLDDVSHILDKEDFYLETNRRLFDAMCALRAAHTPVDAVTLGGYLRDKGQLEKVGGVMMLSGLTDNVAVPSNASFYAEIVRKKGAVRNLIYCAQGVLSSAYNEGGLLDSKEVLEPLLDAAQGLTKMSMPDSIGAYGESVLELYRKVAGGYRGIPLMWPTLNNMTSGLWPRTLTMFVARPSVGKSFIAIISGMYAWLQGYKVLIVSPEMSKEEMAERFFALHAQVSYKNLVAGALSDMQIPKFEKIIEDGKGIENLWIMDSEDDLSLSGVEGAIRAAQPDLVAVDSIYSLRVTGDRRERAVGALEWMNDAAKRLNFVCIGFAQQNRRAEESEKKGGGARLGTIALADEIGQDAHNVFALEQSKDDKADFIMKIKPLKIRRGQVSKPSVRLNWDFDKMIYDEIPDDNEDDYEDDKIPF